MFDVMLEPDEHNSHVMRLRITHNGMAWSEIELRTPAEAQEVADALRDAIGDGRRHPDHAWDCIANDGYGLCNCGANLRSTD